MKIGIDGGALSITDERLKVGVYRVVVNLLRGLGRIDRENTYYIYSFDPIEERVMKQFGPAMDNKVLWPVKGWFTVRLPLELRLHPVDLYLGVSQAIPQIHIPAIGFIYDLAFLYHPESYPGSLEKLKRQTAQLVKRSKHIITISQAVKSDIEKEYGFPGEHISVAYPGVDERFTRSGPVYKGKNPYFLFVGALKIGKNVPRIIKAFFQFLAKKKTIYDLYLVGGEYWKDPAIDQAIKQFNLHGRVKKFGFIPDSDLPELYRGATAFVSPSLHEGFCVPAIEAMACGCPVIGSIEGAMKEIVGEAGILVNPEQTIAIEQAMHTMAYNAKQRDRYTVKGIQQSKKYSWDTFSQIILHEIHQILPQA